MTGLLIKLVVCPIVVYLSGVFFSEVYFPAIFYPIIIGLILGVVAHMMEVWMLKPGSLWISTIVDFFVAAIVVYLLGLALPGVKITPIGAINTGLMFLFTEYALHIWLIWQNKTRKGQS